MKTIQTILLSIFLSFMLGQSFAQSLELSLQSGSFTIDNSLKKFDTDFDTFTKQDQFSSINRNYAVNMVTDFTKDTLKIYRFIAGYGKRYHEGVSSINVSTGDYSTNTNEVSRNTAYLGFGYGRKIPLHFSNQQFTIKYGVIFPLQVTHNDKETRYYDRFYKGIDSALTEEKNNYPNTFNVGVSLFTSVNYNFFKSFYIGIEMQNGIFFTYQKGTNEGTYTYFDPITRDQIDQLIAYEEIDIKRFSPSLMNVAFSLTYRF